MKRMLLNALAIALLTAACLPASAATITYQYNGPTALNSLVKNANVEVSWTIDTSIMPTVVTATNYRYDNAIVAGYFKIDSVVYPFDITGKANNLPGRQNDVIVATGIYDVNRHAYFNAMYIHISTDFALQNGLTPSNILVNLFDFDSPPDGVLNLDLDQPLTTFKTAAQGGVDAMAFGMGAYNGSVFGTVTSGGGSIIQPAAVPEPATGVMALAGLFMAGIAARRKRPASRD